jgi:hypothetical protein
LTFPNRQPTTLTISISFTPVTTIFRMKLSLPLLVFTVFANTDVVVGKKRVLQSKKLRGDKNVLRNQDNKLDAAVPSTVDPDRDLQQDATTRIVGGNIADNGEYPYFGESVQSTRRLQFASYSYIHRPKELRAAAKAEISS